MNGTLLHSINKKSKPDQSFNRKLYVINQIKKATIKKLKHKKNEKFN